MPQSLPSALLQAVAWQPFPTQGSDRGARCFLRRPWRWKKDEESLVYWRLLMFVIYSLILMLFPKAPAKAFFFQRTAAKFNFSLHLHNHLYQNQLHIHHQHHLHQHYIHKLHLHNLQKFFHRSCDTGITAVVIQELLHWSCSTGVIPQELLHRSCYTRVVPRELLQRS